MSRFQDKPCAKERRKYDFVWMSRYWYSTLKCPVIGTFTLLLFYELLKRLTNFTNERLFAGTIESIKVGFDVIWSIQIQAGRTTWILIESVVDSCPRWKVQFVLFLWYYFVIVDPVPFVCLWAKLSSEPQVSHFLNQWPFISHNIWWIFRSTFQISIIH